MGLKDIDVRYLSASKITDAGNRMVARGWAEDDYGATVESGQNFRFEREKVLQQYEYISRY